MKKILILTFTLFFFSNAYAEAPSLSEKAITRFDQVLKLNPKCQLVVQEDEAGFPDPRSGKDGNFSISKTFPFEPENILINISKEDSTKENKEESSKENLVQRKVFEGLAQDNLGIPRRSIELSSKKTIKEGEEPKQKNIFVLRTRVDDNDNYNCNEDPKVCIDQIVKELVFLKDFKKTVMKPTDQGPWKGFQYEFSQSSPDFHKDIARYTKGLNIIDCTANLFGDMAIILHYEIALRDAAEKARIKAEAEAKKKYDEEEAKRKYQEHLEKIKNKYPHRMN